MGVSISLHAQIVRRVVIVFVFGLIRVSLASIGVGNVLVVVMPSNFAEIFYI
jgi:hypothetical protein